MIKSRQMPAFLLRIGIIERSIIDDSQSENAQSPSDETTNHSTRLANNTSQVADYPRPLMLLLSIG